MGDETEPILAEIQGVVGDAGKLDLDAFWDEIIASERGDDLSTGTMNLDEARQKGIIAPDFEPDE